MSINKFSHTSALIIQSIDHSQSLLTLMRWDKHFNMQRSVFKGKGAFNTTHYSYRVRHYFLHSSRWSETGIVYVHFNNKYKTGYKATNRERLFNTPQNWQLRGIYYRNILFVKSTGTLLSFMTVSQPSLSWTGVFVHSGFSPYHLK